MWGCWAAEVSGDCDTGVAEEGDAALSSKPVDKLAWAHGG
jgi:hypothetical protein